MSSEEVNCCSKISQKVIFSIMGFVSMVSIYALKVCLSIAIPYMVIEKNTTKTFSDDTCPADVLNSQSDSSAIDLSKRYDWSEEIQGIILSSFYLGYTITHLPGGIIAEKFGGKYTLGFGVLISSVFTLVTPVVVEYESITALIFTRIFMGLFAGVTQPAINALLSQWIPPKQRSRYASFVFVGALFGIVIVSTSASSILAWFGWPGIFYTFGSLGIVWFFLWVILCYNNPREHPFISAKEQKYLYEQLSEHVHADPPPVPWRNLLCSGPFWGLVAATIGRDWAGYIMISDFPKYTVSVLKFTMDDLSLLFFLSNIPVLIYIPLISWLSDWIIKKRIISRTNVRKFNTTLALGFSGIFTLCSSYVGCDKAWFLITLTLSSLLQSNAFPGSKANTLDISPNYAGTVMAISHGFGGVCGIVGPYVVGRMVKNQTLAEWRSVFWLIFIVQFITNILYVLLASGEVQYWNKPTISSNRKNEQSVEVTPPEAENLLSKNETRVVSNVAVNTE